MLFYLFGPLLVGLVAHGTSWVTAAVFVRPDMIAIGLGAMVVQAVRTFLAGRRSRREAGWR